jgi:hypothetical protein
MRLTRYVCALTLPQCQNNLELITTGSAIACECAEPELEYRLASDECVCDGTTQVPDEEGDGSCNSTPLVARKCLTMPKFAPSLNNSMTSQKDANSNNDLPGTSIDENLVCTSQINIWRVCPLLGPVPNA